LIGNAHAPNKVIDVVNVLLVWLRGKDNKRAPRSVAFSNPAVSEECLLLFVDNFGFVRSIARLTAADRLRTTGVHSEFESKDGFAGAGFVEDIPVFLNKHFNFTTGDQIDVGAYM
jgi:hypothetical protein